VLQEAHIFNRKYKNFSSELPGCTGSPDILQGTEIVERKGSTF
jgi:hypothetical protein